jgi:hypothetical protein
VSQTPEAKARGGGQYDANYGNFQTELYEEIRREAFGEDIGQNSWLTAEEQDRFLGWLELSGGKTVLDVACGLAGRRCAWPMSAAARLRELTCTRARLPPRAH